MKLNLGCGWDHREGYLNVDLVPEHKPDLVADVLDLPFEAGVADEIFAQDVLEHLPRTSTNAALAEWCRVTEPGGLAKIRVPSLFHAVDMMRAAGTLAVHTQLLQNLYGTQAYTGDVHLTSFTDLTIAASFFQAGYRSLTAELVDDWMWDVTAYAHRGSPLATFWASGIYLREGDDRWSWRWADRKAELVLINASETEMEVSFSALIVAEHAVEGSVVATLGNTSQEVEPGNQLTVRTSIVAGGRTELRFEADLPPVPADDPRSLYFMLGDPVVCCTEPGE